MKKVLIIGSKGMAGHLLRQYLLESGEFEIADVARDKQYFAPVYEADVENKEHLFRILKDCKPDFVINCVGILNKAANDYPDRAVLINAYLPHYLAKMGDELNYKFIHVSTDCVFSGNKGSYLEGDYKDGKDFYAQSKALGEVNYGKHLTIRTSIIGPEMKANGIGLVHWFLTHESPVVKGYTKAYWSGVTTFQLAKFIGKFMGGNENISGLIHLTNNEKINKYDLLTLVKETFQKYISLTAYDDYVVDKSLISSKPNLSASVPSYKVMIKDMKQWMDDHRAMYETQYSF